ncbi:MAG TPA: tetratricopeptide repeat protein, partial [Myxococcota bacterium]|nr:tetratricopeptide repeat protein [Myxococcota bacterium]
ERLRPLDPVARDVARVVALARRALDLDTLIPLFRAVGGDEAVVLDAVGVLVDADILVERRAGDVDQVELAHYRLSDLLIEELGAEERCAWHRRLGELLERQHRHERYRVVDELAWHFEQADLPPKAYAYLLEAARKHMSGSSYEEGLYHLERAQRMEVGARPLMLLDEADRRLATLYLERTRALYHLGRWDRALESAVEAWSLAELVRDPALSSQVAYERGHVLRSQARLDEAEEALQRALDEAGEAGIPALRLFPLYNLAALRWSQGNLEAAESLWSQALSLAREQEDHAAEAQVYNGLGILGLCRGQSSEARRLWERSAELYDRLGMVEALAVTRSNLVELYKLTGDLGRALRLADRSVARAREVRHTLGIALGLSWRARVLRVLGRYDEARRNADEALRLANEIGARDEQILGLRTMIEIQLAAGSGRFAVARAEHLLDLLRAGDSEGVLPQVRASYARCLAARGDHAEAVRVLESAGVEEAFPHVQVRAELESAVAWRELGRPERARPHLDRLLAVTKLASFRLYELAALQELARISDRPEEVAASRARGVDILRAVTSGLDRADRDSFERAFGAAGGPGIA